MNTLWVDSTYFSYSNKVKTLSGIFLKIDSGDIVGVLGRNGSGKTTLIKSIFGLLANDKGNVKINDTPIKRNHRWKYIGYLPEYSFLPSQITVKQAIRLFYIKKEILDLFYKDDKLKDFIGRKIRNLSEGEKRYLEFLLIYNLERPFILFDEPFDKIEPKYIELLINKMKDKKDERGYLISGHNYREITGVSNRLTILEDNSLLEISNNINELVKHNYIPHK